MTMCGRFAQITPSGVLINLFAVTDSLPLQPRYNIAPTQDVASVRASGHQRHLALLRWGLVPHWAKDISIGYKTFNARSETVHEKPSFKAAFNLRRCLIPASGFYEWDKLGSSRQPYYVSRSDGRPLALAGLWEAWADRLSGELLESCTILTTSANQTLGRIHDRMPVILPQSLYEEWLEPVPLDLDRLQEILVPHPAEGMDVTTFDGHLYIARRRAEKALKENDEVFYIPSMSSQVDS